jgi:repressor LexA
MYEIFENLLNERGVTRADVTRATGIVPSTFTDWKSGRSKPGVEKLYLLAKFFEVPIEYFLEKKEEE